MNFNFGARAHFLLPDESVIQHMKQFHCINDSGYLFLVPPHHAHLF